VRLGKLSNMTEYETNPQQPGRPEPGAPDETAELRQQAAGGAAGSGAERSQPQATQPAQAEHAEHAEQTGHGGQTGQAEHGGQTRQAEQAGQAEPATPPAAGPYAPPAATPYAPPAATPYTPAGGPYTPAGGPYAPGGGPYAPAAGPWGPPAAAAPQSAPPNPWQQPTSGAPGSGVPQYEPQPAAAANQPPPIWAAQPGPGEAPTTLLPPPATYRQPSRAGRRLAASAAVLALAVGSGVLGGWVALQADDDPTPTTNVGNATNASNRNSAPAPVINRDDLANVAAAVQPSVVSIKTSDAQGSGVVYDAQGDIVTNNHVVADANGSVTVTFNDGKNVRAEVVNTDARSDLAVVKVSNVSGLTPAKIGDSGAMRVGDAVLALGSPLGLDGTVTAGIISALDRTIQEGQDQQPQNPFQQQQQQQGGVQSISGLLQTDAPINPGNSGGALANTNGEVIGINTAIYGDSGGNIGLGFAIPSNKVKAVADQLIKGEKVKHPFLGVSVADATDGGALVRSVTANGPAAKAGIQEGDVITKLGDKAVGGSDDLVSVVQSGNVGDRLEVNYTRNGEQKTATVTLADAS
jgi:putative serine protease PepD